MSQSKPEAKQTPLFSLKSYFIQRKITLDLAVSLMSVRHLSDQQLFDKSGRKTQENSVRDNRACTPLEKSKIILGTEKSTGTNNQCTPSYPLPPPQKKSQRPQEAKPRPTPTIYLFSPQVRMAEAVLDSQETALPR